MREIDLGQPQIQDHELAESLFNFNALKLMEEFWKKEVDKGDTSAIIEAAYRLSNPLRGPIEGEVAALILRFGAKVRSAEYSGIPYLISKGVAIVDAHRVPHVYMAGDEPGSPWVNLNFSYPKNSQGILKGYDTWTPYEKVAWAVEKSGIANDFRFDPNNRRDFPRTLGHGPSTVVRWHPF